MKDERVNEFGEREREGEGRGPTHTKNIEFFQVHCLSVLFGFQTTHSQEKHHDNGEYGEEVNEFRERERERESQKYNRTSHSLHTRQRIFTIVFCLSSVFHKKIKKIKNFLYYLEDSRFLEHVWTFACRFVVVFAVFDLSPSYICYFHRVFFNFVCHFTECSLALSLFLIII